LRDIDKNAPRCYRYRRRLGKIMRRRLEILPIVLLAVLVQLMAPIAAFRVVAYAASDPLYLAATCAEMAASQDGQTAPATQHHAGGCCAVCAGGHGMLSLDAPASVAVELQRSYQRVAWLEPDYPLPVIRAGSNAQARAPPHLS
jgi:Protein of unknown function (DUF2946)